MPFLDLAEGLRQTVDGAGKHLNQLTEADVALKPAPTKWSKKEILGHLIDSACNNHQRFVRAVLEGELDSPRYEQEGWARCQGYANADWTHLKELWRLYNLHLATVIARIPDEQANVPCRIGGAAAVTLHFLVEDYVNHMKHHLRQLGCS
jgi:hypothetical protein